MILHSQSEKETQQFGSKLAKKLEGGDIVALHGDLGAGKTTFVKGLAKGFGIKENISSPTFVLLKMYPLSSNLYPLITNLIHIDLYRLSKQSDIASLGLSDYLGKKNYICVIEWAEKIKAELEKFGNKVYWIRFDYADENKRRINVKFQSSNVK